jgi:hypothetical protein
MGGAILPLPFMTSWRVQGHYCTQAADILLRFSVSVIMICSPFYVTHSPWSVLAILYDSFSLICSPFYVTHYGRSLRHFIWLILLDLLVILCDSFSLICLPFCLTHYGRSLHHFKWPIFPWSARHCMWFILVDLISLFCMTHSRWSVRHSTWLILDYLFSLFYMTHSRTCSPFYVTRFPWYLLITDVILLAVLVTLRVLGIINLTNVNFITYFYSTGNMNFL